MDMDCIFALLVEDIFAKATYHIVHFFNESVSFMNLHYYHLCSKFLHNCILPSLSES